MSVNYQRVAANRLHQVLSEKAAAVVAAHAEKMAAAGETMDEVEQTVGMLAAMQGALTQVVSDLNLMHQAILARMSPEDQQAIAEELKQLGVL